MSGWYRRLDTPRSKAARLRDVRRYEGESRTPPVIRNEKLVFFKAYGKSIFLNGYKVKICSRYHIAKFFGVPLSTVHSWDRNGALPEPFLWQDGPQGKYPIYLSSQMRVLLIVVRDLVSEGYVSIPWSRLPDHLAMLHEGYQFALRSFQARYQGDDEIETADRFGVILLD